MLGALAGELTAQLPEFQETPAEYQDAVEEASKLGGYLFTKYHYLQRGREVLKSAGQVEVEIEGVVLGAEGELLFVRFIGSVEGEPRVFYEVQFDRADRAELTQLDPPGELGFWDALGFFGKRAALDALPMRCADEYLAILGRSTSASAPRDVFLVPLPSTEGEIPIGGFARITVGGDGRTVLNVEALSKGCLTMPQPVEGLGEPFLITSHLLSSTPLPTHALLSRMYEKPLVVSTDAGQWAVGGPQIAFLGPPPEEECCEEALADSGTPRPPAGIPENWEHADEDASQVAPWRERLLPFRETDAPEGEWLSDERFEGRAPADYPNDLPVVFPPDPGGQRFELMWVRIHAYDEEHDRYLGRLLNQPAMLEKIEQGDYVVFGYDSVLDGGLARHDGGDYEALAVPAAVRGGALTELYRGVRHYWGAEYGNVGEEVDACVETLEQVLEKQADSLDEHHRYLAHYLLGRCLAEIYETDRAIEQFEEALALRPEALDPHMALLAELRVKVQQNRDDASIEERYLDQLAFVREHYSDRVQVSGMLGMVFDRRNAGDLSDRTPEEIAWLERVGFGLFRWKMP